jgi:anti-anti-sigma factor
MTDRLFVINQNDSVLVLGLLLPFTLDAIEFDRLNEAMSGVIASHPSARWVIDLSQMEYNGSATLGLVVNIRQYVKQARATLVLCGLSPRLLEMFQACSLVTICPTREEAIERARRMR